MANVITWLGSHWKDVVLAALAIDAALIPILPNVTLLEKIQAWLTPLAK